MGRIIALLSGKGGVGKTTLTANFSISLASRGLSVCAVDADIAMANLSLLLNMQSAPITLHDVLLGEAIIQDAVYDGPHGLKLIPSGLSLDNYRRVDVERLASAISQIKNQYDYILLDCPAGIEKNVIAVLAASTEAFLITTPDSPSIADVLKAKITAQRVGTKLSGVIINMVRGEKGEISKEDISRMLELPVYGTIPFDEDVRRSFITEKPTPLVIRYPKSPAATEVQKICTKITGLKPTETKTTTPEQKTKKQGFISKLLNLFRRK
jgi:septum site-determining protein MinD